MYNIKDEITGRAAGTEEIQSRTVKTGSTFAVTDTGALSVGSKDIANTFDIVKSLEGAAPQTDANWGTIFIAPRRCTINSIKASWGTKTTDVGACTLQVERLQGTEAKDAGDDLLSTAIDMTSGTANNTVYTGTLTTTTARLTLEAGNRLGFVAAGTKAALADVAVVVEVEYDPA